MRAGLGGLHVLGRPWDLQLCELQLEAPCCVRQLKLLCNRCCLVPPPGHKNAVLEVHWTPDGERLVSCSPDKTVRRWAGWRQDWPLGGAGEDCGCRVHL